MTTKRTFNDVLMSILNGTLFNSPQTPPGPQMPTRTAPEEMLAIPPQRGTQLKPDAKALLDFIAQYESRGDYNTVYGGAKKPLDKMTLDEVLQMQAEQRKQGAKSTAVGRYQFINNTLSDLKKNLKLSGQEKFDSSLQDQLATALLKRRGWEDFSAGKIDEARFMRNLSKEWAALPKDQTGKSYYAGDGLNKALVPPDKVLELLSQLRPSKKG